MTKPSPSHASPKRLALALVLASCALNMTAARAKNTLSCEMLPRLMKQVARTHIGHQSSASDPEEIRDRATELYIKRLDPSKSLLLSSDRAALQVRIERFFDQVETGSCRALDDIHSDQIRWHKAAERYVKELLAAKNFEVDASIRLKADPDDRNHPMTNAERDALRRKLVHFQFANYTSSGTSPPEAKKRLIHRYELITRRVGELDSADIYSIFLDAYANAFDPHTSYFSAEALEDFRIGMELSLEGIGAVLSARDGYTTVQEIVPGGAADRQGGLRTQDKIISVAQGQSGEPVDVIDMALREVVRMIRGRKGTDVRLTVLRQDEKTDTHTFVITRDKIDLKEQAAKLRYETRQAGGRELKLAVIELPSFYGGSGPSSRQCTDDVERLLEQAQREKADGLLLDLARNGGGLLQHAVEISGYFLRTGAIVAIKGHQTQRQVLQDRDDRIQFKGPLVVLTSKVSASASEILAGAVKDYRRGVIVGGEHTFGKGTVQNIINLPPGYGALKVTTAMFYRPGGRSTQNDGVAADIALPSAFDSDDFGERNQPYPLPTAQISPFRSESVNAEQSHEMWHPVTPALLDTLRQASTERVRNDDKLTEIVTKLQEAREKHGIIRLADILEEESKETDDGDEDSKTSPEGDATKRPDKAVADKAVADKAVADKAVADKSPSSDKPAAAVKSRKPTPQSIEALNILADLVVSTTQPTPDVVRATP